MHREREGGDSEDVDRTSAGLRRCRARGEGAGRLGWDESDPRPPLRPGPYSDRCARTFPHTLTQGDNYIHKVHHTVTLKEGGFGGRRDAVALQVERDPAALRRHQKQICGSRRRAQPLLMVGWWAFGYSAVAGMNLPPVTTQMQKDMMVDAEKLDLERDRLEADTTIDLMKVAADVNKEDSTEAMALLKENMSTTREAMKQNVRNNGAQNRSKKAADEA